MFLPERGFLRLAASVRRRHSTGVVVVVDAAGARLTRPPQVGCAVSALPERGALRHSVLRLDTRMTPSARDDATTASVTGAGAACPYDEVVSSSAGHEVLHADTARSSELLGGMGPVVMTERLGYSFGARTR